MGQRVLGRMAVQDQRRWQLLEPSAQCQTGERSREVSQRTRASWRPVNANLISLMTPDRVSVAMSVLIPYLFDIVAQTVSRFRAQILQTCLQRVHDPRTDIHQLDGLDECRADHARLGLERELDDPAGNIMRDPDQVIELLIHGWSWGSVEQVQECQETASSRCGLE